MRKIEGTHPSGASATIEEQEGGWWFFRSPFVNDWSPTLEAAKREIRDKQAVQRWPDRVVGNWRWKDVPHGTQANGA